MFNYTADWSDAAVRRFIRRIGGAEMVGALFTLRNADTSAMEQEIGSDYLIQLKRRIKKIIKEENALHLKDIKVNGQDIMRTLKIPSGPKVGKILNDLLETVLDDPKLNSRSTLLKMIKGYA